MLLSTGWGPPRAGPRPRRLGPDRPTSHGCWLPLLMSLSVGTVRAHIGGRRGAQHPGGRRRRSDRDRLRRGVAEESAQWREPKWELDDGRHRFAGVDVDQLTCSEHRVGGTQQFDDIAAGIDGAELKQARLVGALGADDPSGPGVAKPYRTVGQDACASSRARCPESWRTPSPGSPEGPRPHRRERAQRRAVGSETVGVADRVTTAGLAVAEVCADTADAPSAMDNTPTVKTRIMTYYSRKFCSTPA